MALDAKIKKLAIDLANQRPTTEFSLADMEETLRVKMAELVCDENGKVNFYKWDQNKKYIFELIGAMLDEITPRKAKEAFAMFADVKTFAHGDKPRFSVKKGKNNVRRFVTKVAAAGIYDRVRLDRTYVDVDTYAHGGAVYQTLEGFLTGRESITEVLGYLMEGMQDAVYDDLITALEGTLASLPAANKHEHAGWSKTDFDRILNTVRAYGEPVIVCTQEFAGSLVPDSGFIGDPEKADMRNQGYIGRYMGSDVVLLPQSFTDITNTIKVIDPQFCYVIPSGAFEKPIKIAFEGDTLVRQFENADWSVEIQTFRKMGIAVLHTNHFGIYKNTSLS